MSNARYETTMEERKKAANEIHTIFEEFGPAFEHASDYDIGQLMALHNKELFPLRSTMVKRKRNFMVISDYLGISNNPRKLELLRLSENLELQMAADRIREYYKKKVKAKQKGQNYDMDWVEEAEIFALVEEVEQPSNKKVSPSYPDAAEEFLSPEELEAAYGTMSAESVNKSCRSNIMCLHPNGPSSY